MGKTSENILCMRIVLYISVIDMVKSVYKVAGAHSNVTDSESAKVNSYFD